jgi:hypothetical protein
MKRTCTGKQEVCTRGNDVNFVFKRRNARKPTILIVTNADGNLNQATIASFPRIFNEFFTNIEIICRYRVEVTENVAKEVTNTNTCTEFRLHPRNNNNNNNNNNNGMCVCNSLT